MGLVEIKPYMFYHKNSSAIMTLKASSYLGAVKEFTDLVDTPHDWKCDEEFDDQVVSTHTHYFQCEGCKSLHSLKIDDYMRQADSIVAVCPDCGEEKLIK